MVSPGQSLDENTRLWAKAMALKRAAASTGKTTKAGTAKKTPLAMEGQILLVRYRHPIIRISTTGDRTTR